MFSAIGPDLNRSYSLYISSSKKLPAVQKQSRNTPILIVSYGLTLDS